MACRQACGDNVESAKNINHVLGDGSTKSTPDSDVRGIVGYNVGTIPLPCFEQTNLREAAHRLA